MLEGINSRLNDTEDWIRKLENSVGNHWSWMEKGKMVKRNEDSLRDLLDNIMCTNICIIWVPEEKREKGAEKIFEDIITENFPNLGKNTDIQVQEAERVPNKINPRRTTPGHTLIKVAKIKDKTRILKAARAKQQVTNEDLNKAMRWLFSRTLQNRREWFLIFKVVKWKNLQPRTLYPARFSFTFGGEIKFYRQAKKAKRVLHPQSNFIRNVTGTFLTEKEKATTRNMKIMKGRQRVN